MDKYKDIFFKFAYRKGKIDKKMNSLSRNILLIAAFISCLAGYAVTSADSASAMAADSTACTPADTAACMAADSPVGMYPSHESVGLVLSGGGAKGIAHIGVIQALEDNHIPIDFVAGTSMGAIVGGLYACGYTPAEMMSLILSPEFALWSTGQIDPNLTYYFLRQPKTPSFANLTVNLGDKSDSAPAGVIPKSLISPLPMNFAFMDLFAGYTAQCGGDFNRLMVPFRCVASDVKHKHKVVCSKGMLSDAIRASMTFPAAFEPIRIDGNLLYDGGIYDNFPVDVMREDFAPDVMIGVDVHTETDSPDNSIVGQLENMIIQNSDYTLPASEGIRIHVDASKYSLLDFAKASEIYDIGYRRAMEMMDSVKGRVTARIPAETRRLQRRVFKSASPYVRFDSVKVGGGTPKQNAYLRQMFDNMRHHADTFGIERARLAYYRALTPGKLRNLYPQAHYNDSTGLFTLDLDADVKKDFSVGAGGYLSSSVNSMIFLEGAYSSMSFSSWTARLMGWGGQSYMAAQGDVSFNLNRSTPSALQLIGVVSRQKYYENDKLFFEDNSPSFISTYEIFGRLSYNLAVGRHGKASVGIGGGKQRSKYYSSEIADFVEYGSEQTHMDLGEAVGRLEINSLDNQSYPAEGTRLQLSLIQTFGRYRHFRLSHDQEVQGARKSQHWGQTELNIAHYFTMGKNLSLGVEADALLSNRPLLNTYYASIVNAPAFSPFASIDDVFNKAFHANSFVAAGLIPVWKPMARAQVRLGTYVFLPMRRIERTDDGGACYGKWLRHPEFMSELDLVYNLPFASITGYVNYLSSPARQWGVGLSFGLYFTASKFLR